MKNKIVLITGAARGMGAVTARELALTGAEKVILVDWEGEHGTRTRDAINAECKRAVADFIYCDISSMQDVRRLAKYVSTNYAKLDVLINNAGITDPVRRVSVDGYEMHIATCHLGHFLLTNLLMPLLKATDKARVLIISSDAHRAGETVNFDDFNNEKIWKGKKVNNLAAFLAYQRAKLCNIYFMQGLVERLDKTGIKVNAVSPGYFVNTTVYRNMTGIYALVCNLVFGFGTLLNLNTPEQGARSHIWLASAPDEEIPHGKYIEHCKEKTVGEKALNPETRDKLWKLSEEITGVSYG